MILKIVNIKLMLKVYFPFYKKLEWKFYIDFIKYDTY